MLAGPLRDIGTNPQSLRSRIRSLLPESFSRRAVALAVAIAVQLLFLAMLISLGLVDAPVAPNGTALTTFDARQAPAAEQQAEDQEAQSSAKTPPVTRNNPSPAPIVLPPTALPRDNLVVPPAPIPPAPEPEPEEQPQEQEQPRIRAVIREGSNYGPPNAGRRSRSPDSQVVGTAPDGSPLYAASWYREPYDSELAGYLSTANSPGWGMIICRTAPDWRVEDCEVMGESPQGSGIARATLAAAWQFQVRPPRLDGEYQVGAWVRIRMDYGIRRGP